jgi:hypothetical protein
MRSLLSHAWMMPLCIKEGCRYLMIVLPVSVEMYRSNCVLVHYIDGSVMLLPVLSLNLTICHFPSCGFQGTRSTQIPDIPILKSHSIFRCLSHTKAGPGKIQLAGLMRPCFYFQSCFFTSVNMVSVRIC